MNTQQPGSDPRLDPRDKGDGPRDYVMMKRGFFYNPRAAGYTTDPASAGRYSKSYAEYLAYPHDEPVTMHHISEFSSVASVRVETLEKQLDMIAKQSEQHAEMYWAEVKTAAEYQRRAEAAAARLTEAERERDELERVVYATRQASIDAMKEIRALVGATDADPLPAKEYVANAMAVKESALTVLNGIKLQDIAKEIGLTLGKDVGPEILPWIKAAKKDVARLDWLQAHPLQAEIRGGVDDGKMSTVWAVGSATTNLREAIDIVSKKL